MLLKIFNLSIPFMPKTASSFAGKLTLALLPMINNPSRGLQVICDRAEALQADADANVARLCETACPASARQ